MRRPGRKFRLIQTLRFAILPSAGRSRWRPNAQPTEDVSDFRPLNDHELDRLDSDGLIAYIRAADAAGDGAAAERALGILVFRHIDDVRWRIVLKIPGADVDDVATEVVASAINSTFAGEAKGQFLSWLNTIVKRRIADYHRKRASQPDTTPYPEEHAEAEDIWGASGAVEDETGVVEVQSVVEQGLAELNEVHRRVVELYVFEDWSAQETADEINKMFEGHPDLSTPMTNDNVHQIKRRFSEWIRRRLNGTDPER